MVCNMKLANGTALTLPAKIHMGAVQHFYNFLAKECDTREPDLNALINVEITDEENEELMKCPTKLESK